MRPICISAPMPIALASALYVLSPALAHADPLQMTFSPYAMSQPAPPQYYAAPQAAQQPQYYAAPQPMQQPQYYPAPQPVQQQYAQPPQAQYVYAQPQGYGGAVSQTYAAAPQGYAVAPQRYAAAQPQTYAPQAYAPQPAAPAPMPVSYAAAPAAPPPQPAPPSGGRGFLEGIFGGPTIQTHAYQPAMPAYQSPPAPEPQPYANNPAPGYAPSSQGDMSSYPIDPRYNRQVVEYRGEERPGTIIIDTPNKFLYLVEDNGKALRYGIGVGRPGFTWAGVKTITAKRNGRIGGRRPTCCSGVPICRAIWPAASTIRSGRVRCISARRSTASTAPTSPGPSAPMCRRAASACATKTSAISTAA